MPSIPHVPSTLVQYAYRGLTATIAVILIFSLAPISLNNTDRINLMMKDLGTLSLGLYVCHLTIIWYIVNVLNSYLTQSAICMNILVNFIVCTIISVIIVKALNRNKITAKVLLGKI